MPIARATLLVASLFATACSDPFSPEGLAGTYELKTINEQPLPFAASNTYTAGSLTLNANSTWIMLLMVTIPSFNSTFDDTLVYVGSLTLAGQDTMQFASQQQSFSGTREGGRLIIRDFLFRPGDRWEFEQP